MAMTRPSIEKAENALGSAWPALCAIVRADEVTTTAMQGGSDPAKVEREPAWLDRVTAPDLMLIWPEEQGWPQDIGALAILDGRSLFDAHG